MDNLIFKSNDAAFTYARRFFGKSKLSLNSSFIGIVKFIDTNNEPNLYDRDNSGRKLLKRKDTMLVAAMGHPDLSVEIKQDDLVIFGPTNISLKIPAGYLIHKLEPEYDTQKEQFIIHEPTEKIESSLDVDKAVERGKDLWRREVDHKYGLLLQESEIIESDTHLYFCQTNRKKLCAGWDKEKERWEVNVERSLLEGLSFSTPKRFDQVVFWDETDDQRHYRKQFLIEYLLLGLEVGEIKNLTKDLDNDAKIEFSLDAKTWNRMLIGNLLRV